MQRMKSVVVLAAIIASVAVSACRREVPHQPMKLGAELSAVEHVAR